MEELLQAILIELKTVNEKLVAQEGAMEIPEAAAYLKVSENFLRKQAKMNLVPHQRLGDKYLFHRQALSEWFSSWNSGYGRLRKVQG